MRIIVTGAAGFIGSHTVDLLQREHHIVLGIDDYSTGRMENIKDFVSNGGSVMMANVTILSDMNAIFRDFRPECVVHLAAQAAITTSLENPTLDLITNGIGTLTMLQASKMHKVRRFVLASTSAVYRDGETGKISEDYATSPDFPYGCSKLAAESYVRMMFPNHAILRYGNVYGPRQRPIGENQVIARAIQHFTLGDSFYVNGSGNQKRDFIYVGDVALANLVAARGDEKGVFNIARGEAISVMDVLSLLEQVYEVPGYPWDHNEFEDSRRIVRLDVSKASRKLGWRAQTSMLEGLRLTAQWAKYQLPSGVVV